MLADDQDAVAEREALVRPVLRGGVECGMTDRHARGRRDSPPHVLVRAVRWLRPNTIGLGRARRYRARQSGLRA